MRGAIALATVGAAILVALLAAAYRMPPAPPGAGTPPKVLTQPAMLSRPKPRPATPLGPRPPRGTWLALVYGGNGQGEIEPCG